MAITSDSVTVELEAKVDKYTGDVKVAVGSFEDGMRRIETAGAKGEGASRKLAQSLGEITKVGGLTRQQLLTIQYTASDVAASLASGASPFTILLQQGGQVLQGLGGVKGAFASLAAYIGGPFAIVAGTTAAALALVALNFEKAKDATVDLEGAGKLLEREQAALRLFFDATTGAINSQITATERLAKAKSLSDEAGKFRSNSTNARASLISTALSATTQQSTSAERGFEIALPFSDTPTKAAIRALTADLVAGRKTADEYGVAIQAIGRKDASLRPLVSQLTELASQTVQADRDLAKSNAQIAAVNGTATETQKALLGIVAPGKGFADIVAKAAAGTDRAAVAQNKYNAEIERLKVLYNDGKGSIDAKQLDTAASLAARQRDAVLASLKPVKSAPASRAKVDNDPLGLRDVQKDAVPILKDVSARFEDLLPVGRSIKETFRDAFNLDTTVAALPSVISGLEQISAEAARARDAGRQFADDLATGLADAIVNGRSLGDVLVNSLKRAAAEAAANAIFNGISGAIGGGSGFGKIGKLLGFANGGTPPVGRASMVGERGPELFVPNTAGRIYPTGTGPGGGGNIYQSISVNLAGNAATKEDAAMFASIAYQQSLAAIRSLSNSGIGQV